MATKRIAVGGVGTIETVSLDRNKPGKVVVKLSLVRRENMVEALSALSDDQLPVAVTLDSLQAEMEMPERRAFEPVEGEKAGPDPPLSDRLRQDVDEALQ